MSRDDSLGVSNGAGKLLARTAALEGDTRAVRRKNKISKGVRMLQKQGCRVQPYTLHGKKLRQIDSQVPVTPEEVKHIGEGRYSLAQLIKRSGITALVERVACFVLDDLKPQEAVNCIQSDFVG